MARTLNPADPGGILREKFMVPRGLSSNRLAIDWRVPVTRVPGIIHARRGITAATGLHFAELFQECPSAVDESS
ncbi:MAG TPA: hypothetical protein VIX91_16510, partial [Candidatus Acidoferrum sp.]